MNLYCSIDSDKPLVESKKLMTRMKCAATEKSAYVKRFAPSGIWRNNLDWCIGLRWYFGCSWQSQGGLVSPTLSRQWVCLNVLVLAQKFQEVARQQLLELVFPLPQVLEQILLPLEPQQKSFWFPTFHSETCLTCLALTINWQLKYSLFLLSLYHL